MLAHVADIKLSFIPLCGKFAADVLVANINNNINFGRGSNEKSFGEFLVFLGSSVVNGSGSLFCLI